VTSRPDDDAALARAAVVMGELIDGYHVVAPEQLGSFVAAGAARLGVEDCTIYLQDYEQSLLIPFPVEGCEEPPIPIDGTLAGSAFTEEAEREEPAGDQVRLWLAVVDGTDRLGVLGATVAPGDETARWFCRRLAGVTGLFLMSKGENSDHQFWLRRRKDMSLPAEMQWQVLPALTVTTPRVAVAGALEPAYDVGGDAFDYAINGDVAHVAIVDAMGHALEASQMSTVAIGAYRHSRRLRAGLVETRRAMDAVVAEQFGVDRFATAQLAELQLDTGELTLLNAGHPAPLLVGADGGSRPVPCVPSLPMGLGIEQEPPLTTVQLEPGDRLLLFSDGVVENRLPDGEPFGDQRLREAFRRACAAGHSASETVRQLSRSFLDEHEGQTRDDATWVLVEWSGPGS
jgi:serine/threonine protein phosphatase PrpC